jgi:hypothetical protein
MKSKLENLTLTTKEKIALEILNEYLLAFAQYQQYEKNGQIRELMIEQKKLSVIRKQALNLIRDVKFSQNLVGPNDLVLKQARDILQIKHESYLELIHKEAKVEEANLNAKRKKEEADLNALRKKELEEYLKNFSPDKKDKILDKLRNNPQFQLALETINLESLKLCNQCDAKINPKCNICGSNLILGNKKKVLQIKRKNLPLFDLIVLLLKSGIKSFSEFENSPERYKGKATIKPNLLPTPILGSHDPRDHKRWQCKWCDGDGGINGGCTRCNGTGIEP